MNRSEDFLMKEIRDAQKNLLASKRRGNSKGAATRRARTSELQKELETVR